MNWKYVIGFITGVVVVSISIIYIFNLNGRSLPNLDLRLFSRQNEINYQIVKTSNGSVKSKEGLVAADFHHRKVIQQLETFYKYARSSMVSAEDRKTYRLVIKTFTDFCDKNNITHFIYSGTLIGSYRHHGFVPWDDDFDVFFNDNQRSQIKSVFSNKQLVGDSKLILSTVQGIRWKVYMDIPEAKKAGGYSFKWPYIDLCFYRDKGSVIQDTGFSDNYKKSDVFPLSRRPFEGMMLWAPRCTRNVLSESMKTKCCPNNWNHKNEHGLSGSKNCIDCSRLKSNFPFVKHQKLSSTLYNETLFLGDSVIGNIIQSDCLPPK